MIMARQWRQRWSGGGGGGGAEAVERQRQQRWRSAPAAKLPPQTPQPSCRSRHHRPFGNEIIRVNCGMIQLTVGKDSFTLEWAPEDRWRRRKPFGSHLIVAY